MENKNIKNITFTKQQMTVHFADGRNISTPLEWHPRLLKDNAKQCAAWQIIVRNRGIHWPELDEDLITDGILQGIPLVEYKKLSRASLIHTQPEARS